MQAGLPAVMLWCIGGWHMMLLLPEVQVRFKTRLLYFRLLNSGNIEPMTVLLPTTCHNVKWLVS
jgi:hypothetical protein